MGALYVGEVEPGSVHHAGVPVDRVYLGGDQVWPSGSVLESAVWHVNADTLTAGLDGLQDLTGGGNHMTFGGSPLVMAPDDGVPFAWSADKEQNARLSMALRYPVSTIHFELDVAPTRPGDGNYRAILGPGSGWAQVVLFDNNGRGRWRFQPYHTGGNKVLDYFAGVGDEFLDVRHVWRFEFNYATGDMAILKDGNVVASTTHDATTPNPGTWWTGYVFSNLGTDPYAGGGRVYAMTAGADGVDNVRFTAPFGLTADKAFIVNDAEDPADFVHVERRGSASQGLMATVDQPLVVCKSADTMTAAQAVPGSGTRLRLYRGNTDVIEEVLTHDGSAPVRPTRLENFVAEAIWDRVLTAGEQREVFDTWAAASVAATTTAVRPPAVFDLLAEAEQRPS